MERLIKNELSGISSCHNQPNISYFALTPLNAYNLSLGLSIILGGLVLFDWLWLKVSYRPVYSDHFTLEQNCSWKGFSLSVEALLLKANTSGHRKPRNWLDNRIKMISQLVTYWWQSFFFEMDCLYCIS